NDTAAETTTINPTDLVVGKAATDGPFRIGDLITFTLTVTNSGRVPATQVALTDTLPAELAYVSGDGGCSETGGEVVCALGTLAASGTASVTIVVTPTASGLLTNSAVVAGDADDPTPADNTAQTTTPVDVANLTVTKTAQPNP